MQPIRRSGVKQWRLFAFLAAIFVLVAVLVFLAGTVRRQLNAVISAPHDNLQWSLSQLDVEHARFSLAVLTALQSPQQDLADVRRRFDLYYSRNEIVAALKSSKHLPTNPEANALLDEILARTQALAAIVDLPDEELRASLPVLWIEIDEHFQVIRELSVIAIKWFATASDDRRLALSNLLYETVLVASLLALILALAFIFLRRSTREARTAQKELSDATARLQSTIGASLDAVIVTDVYGTLLEYNGAAEDVFGYSKDEAIGKIATELLLEEDARQYLLDAYDQLVETKDGPLAEQSLIHLNAVRKGGAIIPIETSIASVLDHNNKTIFISFVRDISERIAASEALRKSRDQALIAANTKSDFIAMMSHEMRTPLNGVIAAHEILAETETTLHQAKFLKIAQSSAIHLLQHVNDVLDISSIDADVPSKSIVFSPLATIANVVESTHSLARERGNSLAVDFTGADETFYFGAEVQFRRILINLLGNAIKFTENGLIQIDFGVTPRDTETVLFELHISDSGRGIPQENIDDIFNAFVRLDSGYAREADGTGLGLSITRKLVTSMGGDIGVESDVGAGSTFWVTVPFQICEQPTQDELPSLDQAMPAQKPRNPKGHNALIVEDNVINQTILRQFLEDEGLEVASAANGQLGVDAAFNERFDYIFMDVSMPVLDGISATHAIKSAVNGASRDTRIIGITAHSSPKSGSECLEAGMSEVLVKPVTREAISKAIGCPRPSNPTPLGQNGELVNVKQVEAIQSILGPKHFSLTCQRFKTDLLIGFKQLQLDLEQASQDHPLSSYLDQIHSLAGLCASMGASKLHKHLEASQQLAEASDYRALIAELAKAATFLEPTVNMSSYDPPPPDAQA